MAKKKDKTPVAPQFEDPSVVDWPPVADLVCDSCHGTFDTVVYHPSAPGIPLCAGCYEYVCRKATRIIQTPSNPERV